MLRELRSKVYPFSVFPLSFSLKGTEGGMNEAEKCAPPVPRGVTAAVPRRLPSLFIKSRLRALLLIFFAPAMVMMTKAFLPIE